MDKPPVLDTPENWDAASKGYAEKVAPVLMEPFASEFVDRLGVDENTEALEVASGSGAFTGELSKRVKSLLAVDFSPSMVEILRERMAHASHVKAEVMDGTALALDDASFDRAACCFGLMLFPDRAKGFSELARVLRPGGRAIVTGWAGREKFGVFDLFTSAVQAAFPDMPPPPNPLPVFSLADLADFKNQMEAAGFGNVEVDYVSRELAIDNFEDLWGMMTIGAPPVRALLDRVGEDGHERIRDTLADIVEKKFGSGPITTTNAATVGCGTV